MEVLVMLEKITKALSTDEKERLKRELSAYLNELLQHDFSALVQLLYRTDVSEQKLKTVLKENKEADAGDLIAGLLIQRQAEKIAALKSFSSNTPPPGDEAW